MDRECSRTFYIISIDTHVCECHKVVMLHVQVPVIQCVVRKKCLQSKVIQTKGLDIIREILYRFNLAESSLVRKFRTVSTLQRNAVKDRWKGERFLSLSGGNWWWEWSDHGNRRKNLQTWLITLVSLTVWFITKEDLGVPSNYTALSYTIITLRIAI